MTDAQLHKAATEALYKGVGKHPTIQYKSIKVEGTEILMQSIDGGVSWRPFIQPEIKTAEPMPKPKMNYPTSIQSVRSGYAKVGIAAYKKGRVVKVHGTVPAGKSLRQDLAEQEEARRRLGDFRAKPQQVMGITEKKVPKIWFGFEPERKLSIKDEVPRFKGKPYQHFGSEPLPE